MNQNEVELVRYRALANAHALAVLKREMEQKDGYIKSFGQDASYGDILKAMSEDEFTALLVLLRMKGEREEILQIFKEARL
jgi:hypothetical protein